MQQKPEQLLAGTVALLDVVVDGSAVLNAALSAAGLGFALAAAAGFAQLFSP